MLKYDMPENTGVMNGIKRAKQFSEIVFHSVNLLPTAYITYGYPNGEKSFFYGSRLPGFPVKGLPYSSAIKYQKLIGYHVSIESFMTAVHDPNSILYKKSLIGGERRNAATWYGTVCSSLATYVWDLPTQHICATWAMQEDVEALGQPPLESLRLLDTILNVGHVAVITGIEREDDGKVTRIEVTESTLPNCRTNWFTPEQFVMYWYQCAASPYKIFRRKDHSSITYTPSPFVYIKADPERGIEADPVIPEYKYNKALLPDHGNGSNYILNVEPVVIDILDDIWTSVEICNAKGEKTVCKVKDHVVEPVMTECGYYTAVAITDDGQRSDSVEFAVVGHGKPIDKTNYTPGENMTIRLHPLVSEDAPLYYSFSDSKTCVTVTRKVIDQASISACELNVKVPTEPGEYFLSLGIKNRYGIYASSRSYFTVE